jgi:hypothetical protein
MRITITLADRIQKLKTTIPLGQAICKFVDEWKEDQSSWEGAASELLDQLKIITQKYKISTNHRSWTRSVNYLTRRLDLISITINRSLSATRRIRIHLS